MKVTIITGPFLCLPPYAIGAVEKLWYSVGKCWINEGIEVTFISKKPDIKNIENNHKYILGYERTGSWIKDFFLDFIYSCKALSQVSECDILILNSLWSPILVRFFKRRHKISIFSVERFPKRQLRIYDKLGKVNYFRCCSSAVYNELIKQSPKLKSKACIIPNFIDTKIFNCNEVRKLSSNPTIVYSGRVNREKGLDILIKAVEFLYQKEKISLNLMIIGARDKERGGSGDEYINILKNMAPNINICWIDPIYNPKELAETIKNGDIFCYPSIADKGETFGVAVLEAMALGLPVIVSDLECFKDFIKNEENGLIFNHKVKNSEEQLAYKIKKLIDSKELFNKISIEGKKSASNFSEEKIAKIYYKKFEELLNVKSIYKK